MENQKEQDLNFENEFLKLKLTAESGAHISTNNLPPKIENEFLNYIMGFEEAAREKRVIKFFDKIQRSNFSLNVDDETIPTEPERLLEHLEKHHIKITTLYEVSDKELYRFIVEDLFEEIINDVPHIEGGHSYFTYEDFYPNHPYDIANRLEDFLQVLTKKEIGLYSWIFSDQFTSVEEKLLTEEEVTKYLQIFFSGFHTLTILFFESKDLKIKEDQAIQNVYMKIEAITGEGVPKIFEGEGKISFENTYGWWNVSGIDIPGLRL